MKHVANTPTLLLIAVIFCFAYCKKDKAKTPLEQLPPETQTGANTFGCLVNGEVFKPGGAQLSGGSLQANYQDLGTGPGGGYHLRIAAIQRINQGNESKSIGLFTDSLRIEEGREYSLVFNNSGMASAIYGYYRVSPTIIEDYETNMTYSGNLRITKLDTIAQIVSGTFWFAALNTTNGNSVNITNGRFDVRYTQ